MIVTQTAKQFAEKLNSCLDDSGAPTNARERSVVLAKMLDISKQQAWNLVEGLQLPDDNLLTQIANEFEVDREWMAGKK